MANDAIGSDAFDTPAMSPGSTMTKLPEHVELGMNLALREEQIKEARNTIEMKKQDMRDKAVAGAFDMLPKLAKTKGKAKDLMFKLFESRMQIAGVPVDPNLKDVIGSDENDAYVLSQIEAGIRSKPELLKDPKFMSEVSLRLGNYERYVEWRDSFVKQMQEQQEKRYRTEVMGQAQAAGVEQRRAAAQMADQRKQEELSQKAPVMAAQASLLGAKATGEQVKADNAPALAQAEIAGKTAKAAKDQSEVGVQQQKADEAARHNLAQEEIMRQRNATLKDRMSAIWARVDQRERTIAQGVNNMAMRQTAKPYETLSYLNRGLVMAKTNPEPRWIDLNEVATEVSRGLTGSSIVPEGREARQNFDSVKKTWDTWMGKIKNHESGGPSPEEWQIFIGRLQRLHDNMVGQYNTIVDRSIDSAAPTKAIKSKQTLQLMKSNLHIQVSDSGYLRPEISADELYQKSGLGAPSAPAPKPGVPAQTAPAKGAPAPGADLETTRATNAIKMSRAGKLPVTEAQIRAKYKAKTGKDLPAF